MEGEGGVGVRLRVRMRTKTIRRNELLALPPLTQGKLLVRAICKCRRAGLGALGLLCDPHLLQAPK